MLPLEGLRVIDLTHVLAGPVATHHLRCLGAEVIKVERPDGGDPMRGLGPAREGPPATFRALNSGKASVVIDLKQAAGLAALLDLAATADVFVENFRPGVAERLGIGPEAIRKRRPDVVYCSISGWGQSGALAGRGAYDHVIQAATGMMALQASGGGAPVKVGFPVVDIATGISAAEAILAALLRRFRGDRAPITLDVSMVNSALALMAGPVATTLATGQAPQPVGNRGFVGSPGAETFATSDGHISVAANTRRQFATLCRLLGRPELAQPPHIPADLPGEAFLAGLASEALRAALSAAFQTADAAALEAQLNAAGVPAARLCDLGEYLAGVYPQTPGIGVPGEPLALGPAFRWDLPMARAGQTPRHGADSAAFGIGPADSTAARSGA